MAEKFKKQFTWLGEYTEKYITLTVSIEKDVTRIDEHGEKITKSLSYILQFIDSARFMVSSLSNIVNNLSEGIHRIKCEFWHDEKKCEIKCGIKYKHCLRSLECINFKDDLVEYICLCCYKNYQRKFEEELKQRFFNTYKFSNHGNNKFILLLQKVVYPYEHMGNWEKFNEISLLETEDF